MLLFCLFYVVGSILPLFHWPLITWHLLLTWQYKESLLGAAAHGDLGNTDDPRRIIVTEFRVVFEDETTVCVLC